MKMQGLLFLIALLAVALVAVAANVTPLGYAEFDATGPFTLKTSAPTRGASMPWNTNVVFLSADGGKVLYTFDGTTPTSTVGHPLADGAMVIFDREKFAIDKLKIYIVAGTAKVTYAKQ